jgi:cytochrome c oxidase subunit 2
MSIEKFFFLMLLPAQLRLQDPSTTTMEGLLEFNKHVLFVITVIVTSWLVTICNNFYDEFNTQRVKVFPLKRFRNCLDFFTSFNFIKFSFTFVYITLFLWMKFLTPEISVKIIGHQWFWSYEISDFDTMATLYGI